MNLQVLYVDVSELKLDGHNPRKHPRRQIEQLKRSIKAFGFTNPLLIDSEGHIICGHGRYTAAVESGMSELPTIRLQGMTLLEISALRIADNKIAQGAVWDAELLKLTIESISAVDINFDLELTGFETPDIDQILRGGQGADPADDAIPAAPKRATTTRGDIWILGRHRIGCGDVRDRVFLEQLMADGRADAAILDPPYNVPISGHAVAKGSHPDFACAVGELSREEFTRFLGDSLGACAAFSKSGAVHFVFMDQAHIEEVTAAGGTVYSRRLNTCVWNKSNAGMGGLYRSKHEFIFIYKVGDASYCNCVQLGKYGRNRTTVWDYASVNTFRASRRADLALHPTVKPVALVADAIKDVTKLRETVLDGFLGSGTTLLACERTGRVCRGLELEPMYVDIAVERWLELTGGEALHVSTGRKFLSAALRGEAK